LTREDGAAVVARHREDRKDETAVLTGHHRTGDPPPPPPPPPPPQHHRDLGFGLGHPPPHPRPIYSIHSSSALSRASTSRRTKSGERRAVKVAGGREIARRRG
jgi:hypothetical protein